LKAEAEVRATIWKRMRKAWRCLLKQDSITLTRGRPGLSLSTRVPQEDQLEAGVEAHSQLQVSVANLNKLQGILA
jgi:hypothetical protein